MNQEHEEDTLKATEWRSNMCTVLWYNANESRKANCKWRSLLTDTNIASV